MRYPVVFMSADRFTPPAPSWVKAPSRVHSALVSAVLTLSVMVNKPEFVMVTGPAPVVFTGLVKLKIEPLRSIPPAPVVSRR